MKLGTPWTAEESEKLRDLVLNTDLLHEEIATAMGRSRHSVACRIWQMDIAVRKGRGAEMKKRRAA